MKEQFIPYEQALKLKELGFDERCFASYYTDVEKNKTEKYDVRKKLNASFDWNPFTDEEDSGYILNSDKEYYVSAPLWQQAFDWFMKQFSIRGFIENKVAGDFGFVIYIPNEDNPVAKPFIRMSFYTNHYKTYEEARLECLKKLIKLAQNN